MVMFCALHDVEAEEKGEVTTVEGLGNALKAATSTNSEPKSTSDVWVASKSSGGIWTLVPAAT